MIFKNIYNANIAHKCTLVNIIKILQTFALVNLHLNFLIEKIQDWVENIEYIHHCKSMKFLGKIMNRLLRLFQYFF